MKHKINKNINMLRISYMKEHVNKLGVLDIVVKPKNYALILQNTVASHQNSLIAMHQKYVHVHPPPRHHPSHVL